MEGKDEDQRPVAQERPKISEEARRFGREDKELRSALRNALCRRKRAHLEWLAKQHGKTPEQLTEGELDAYVEHGWGEAFRLYKAKYERYPLPTELNEVAWMALEESGQTDLSKPRSVLKLGPPAVWRGAMSDDVRAKIREYATHYVNLPETPERRMAETPEGREKVIEFLTNRWAQLGLADALEKHYAEHGCYPDFADIPKFNLKICF